MNTSSTTNARQLQRELQKVQEELRGLREKVRAAEARADLAMRSAADAWSFAKTLQRPLLLPPKVS